MEKANIMMKAMGTLSEEDNKILSKKMEDLQIRDSLMLYNTMVERCFSDCVHSFLRKSLNKQEDTCVRRCVDKFWNLTKQTGVAFTELDQSRKIYP